jgi:hypothetical protein
MIISPPQVYEVKGEVTKVLCSTNAYGTGNNQSIVTAVSGKIIRVMGFTSSGTTVHSIGLKSNSGGTVLYAHYADTTIDGIPYLLPITDSGYFETTVSHGLFADITSANAVNLNVFYITYTP